MTEAADVVVVGAGVVGCAVSYELSSQGIKVLLLEQEALGSGASAHATGFLGMLGAEFTPGPSFALALRSYHMFPDLVPKLEHETGVNLLYQRRPQLRLALDEEEEQFIKAAMAWQGAHLPLRWINGDKVRSIEPRLSPDIRGAVYDQESAQLDSYRFTLALAQGAERQGTVILLRRVIGLQRSNGRVTHVLHTGGKVACGTVVLALGAWSAACADWLDFPIPVAPMKGERLLLAYRGSPLPALLSSPKRGHIINRLDGFLSVGSTGGRDYDQRELFLGHEFDRRPSESAKLELLQRAMDVLPGLEEAEVVHHFAGSRPLSGDRLPIIGPVPGTQGVLLATGHGTKGIHLAPITGRIISDYISLGTSKIVEGLETFAPARFKAQEGTDFYAVGRDMEE